MQHQRSLTSLSTYSISKTVTVEKKKKHSKNPITKWIKNNSSTEQGVIPPIDTPKIREILLKNLEKILKSILFSYIYK